LTSDPVARLRIIAVPEPLDGFNDFQAIFRSRRTIAHVRDANVRHFRSFSFRREIATYWATGGGTHDGYIAECFVRFQHSTTYGGAPEPYVVRTTGGHTFIDPRHLPDFRVNSPLVDEEVRNFSRTDWEVLLARGVLKIAALHPVKARECPPPHVYSPYEVFGQRFILIGGTWVDARWVE
jgi:hypothetical protein